MFAVELAGKGRVAGSTFRLVGKPKVRNLPAHATARRLAERFGGKELSVVLRNADAGLEVRWRAELRDQANTVRQSVTLVTWHNGKRVYQYRIATRRGAKDSWHTAADASKNDKPATAAGYVHRFAPHKARHARVTILKNSEGNQFGGHIVELEVFRDSCFPVEDV